MNLHLYISFLGIGSLVSLDIWWIFWHICHFIKKRTKLIQCFNAEIFWFTFWTNQCYILFEFTMLYVYEWHLFKVRLLVWCWKFRQVLIAWLGVFFWPFLLFGRKCYKMYKSTKKKYHFSVIPSLNLLGLHQWIIVLDRRSYKLNISKKHEFL